MARSHFRAPFLKRITMLDEAARRDEFPFNRLRFLSGAFELELARPITILVGENGTGKSTLVEAIARAAGFPGLGGSQDHAVAHDGGADALADALRLAWLPKVSRGFFFRAESFFGLASYLDEVGNPDRHGGRALHEQSHGEAFLATFQHRLNSQQRAIYLMDEPEVALSPTRQLAFLRILWEWQRSGQVQAIIATHSPILMSLPGAALLSLDGDSIRPVQPEDTEHYQVTRAFLADPERVLRQLLTDD